jgi:hypothetical protein
MVAVPVHWPLQRMLVDDCVDVNAEGCVIVTVCAEVQPFASVIVHTYTPAQRPVAVCVFCTGVVFQL